MEISNLTRRLKDLDDNIKRDLALLKDYEDELHYEDDPRRKSKYNRAIEQLRESANRYQQEYEQLHQHITGEPTVQMQSVAIELQQMNNRLERLSAGQEAIFENINNLRQRLLSRYSASEKNIIFAITERLDQSQVITISAVLDAIEANKISEAEMQNILPSIQQSLMILQQRGVTLPVSQQAIAEIINAPQMDFKHRLKVALPIIPFILDYEGEWELGTGINLKEAWQKLVAPVKGA
ncbi:MULTISPECIES: hypothetical protein [unclassified Microcoleus]|uniref:hypothetical protein n=1 Tax=unclassified Microcoleus TaxID=2642155 RepID=UPI002FD106C6